jgi:starvation-inducible DNA-binding protein
MITAVLESEPLPIDIGIGQAERKAIAERLIYMLGDTQRLYQKTHAYHWNVTGPMFVTLHTMFETQYSELWIAQDVIAERIRALGFFVPPNPVRYSGIPEEEGVAPALEMVNQLVQGHEATARTAREALQVAEDGHDAPTVDLMTERLQVHEKTAWMLRSLLA